jgi:hypothetical protein
MQRYWALLLWAFAFSSSAQMQSGPTISSQDNGERVSAALEGTLDQPLRSLQTALADPQHWCAVLVIHINNKGCVISSAGKPRLRLRVARKYDQPADQASELSFSYQLVRSTPTELSVRLDAADGPFGTSDYSIQLEARAAAERHTAVKFSYEYRQSALTSTAMDLYFATVGRGKVGFTVAASGPGEPELIGGARGLLERNLMRYFFAIDVAASTPVVRTEADYERRLRAWFAATERHPRQLREVDLETYLSLKRNLRDIGIPPSDRAGS